MTSKQHDELPKDIDLGETVTTPADWVARMELTWEHDPNPPYIISEGRINGFQPLRLQGLREGLVAATKARKIIKKAIKRRDEKKSKNYTDAKYQRCFEWLDASKKTIPEHEDNLWCLPDADELDSYEEEIKNLNPSERETDYYARAMGYTLYVLARRNAVYRSYSEDYAVAVLWAEGKIEPVSNFSEDEIPEVTDKSKTASDQGEESEGSSPEPEESAESLEAEAVTEDKEQTMKLIAWIDRPHRQWVTDFAPVEYSPDVPELLEFTEMQLREGLIWATLRIFQADLMVEEYTHIRDTRCKDEKDAEMFKKCVDEEAKSFEYNQTKFIAPDDPGSRNDFVESILQWHQYDCAHNDDCMKTLRYSVLVAARMTHTRCLHLCNLGNALLVAQTEMEPDEAVETSKRTVINPRSILKKSGGPYRQAQLLKAHLMLGRVDWV